MAMKHLDDEQIQELLDGNLAAESRGQIDQHLSECPSCHERTEQYRALYHGLKDEREFVLPPGFAADVVAKAKTPEESSVWMSWPVLGGASLIAVICTLFYVVGADKLMALLMVAVLDRIVEGVKRGRAMLLM